jgi:hypothetical protein
MSMHRLENRVFAAEPNEAVIYETDPDGGAVRVQIDGVEAEHNGTFALSPTPGDQRQLTVTLFGESGTTCFVGIRTVDGGVDGDLLVCQPHDPAPVHFYRFIVVPPKALATISALTGTK